MEQPYGLSESPPAKPFIGQLMQVSASSPSPPPLPRCPIMGDSTFNSGIVYAAGWLVSAHGEDGLAEELLLSADLTTAAACRKAGGEDYDIGHLRTVFHSIRTRENNLRRAPTPHQTGERK